MGCSKSSPVQRKNFEKILKIIKPSDLKRVLIITKAIKIQNYKRRYVL